MTLPSEPIADFADLGIRAFVTTREAGTFGLTGSDPVGDVMARWEHLTAELAPGATRIVSAHQVHGRRVAVQNVPWEGWLRLPDTDGHVTALHATALVVTIADCVPVFIAHPTGAVALLHAGWRGTAAGILDEGLHCLAEQGCAAGDLRIHLGPGICEGCYEVDADVRAAVTGETVPGRSHIDLRAQLARQARTKGVPSVSTSPFCTRCDRDRFFSHRAGDSGRQVAVIATRLS